MAHSFWYLGNAIGLGLFAVGMVGMGCAVDSTGGDFDPSDEQIAEAQQGIGGDPNTQNGIPYKCTMDHGVQQTTRNFGNTRLTDPLTGYLKSMPYMPGASATGDLSGCRREYLKALFGCALATGDSIVDNGDILFINVLTGAVTYKTYLGEVGLAPSWKTTGLGLSEKEFVTACVMARTNRFGVTINISLKGNNPVLAADPVNNGYPYADSTVWGNMFDSTTVLNPTHDPALPTNTPFQGHICQMYQVGYCPNAAYRACDTEDCGFIAHGACTRDCSFLNPTVCTSWPNRISAYVASSWLACPPDMGLYIPTP